MKIKNVTKYELIGLDIKIVRSKNQDLLNLKGRIIDETKNMLIIQSNNKIKKIIKDQVTIELKMNNKLMQIDGKLLVGRSEERIKK